MKMVYRAFKIPFFFTLLLTLAACGDSGGGGGSGFTPTLPANALRITQANAGEVASSAVGSIDGITVFSDVATSLKSAINRPSLVEITQWVIRRAIRRQFVAARRVTENCGQTSADGRVTGEVNENGNRVESDLRFEDCNIFGLELDGQIALDGTYDGNTGDYNFDFNGRISATFGNEPTVTLTFDAQETGNELSGAYTLGFSISVDGPPNTGFLMKSTDDLSGNHFNEEIYDGTIMLFGANSTRLQIDVIGTDFVDIDIDEGSGVFSDYDEVDLNLL